MVKITLVRSILSHLALMIASKKTLVTADELKEVEAKAATSSQEWFPPPKNFQDITMEFNRKVKKSSYNNSCNGHSLLLLSC